MHATMNIKLYGATACDKMLVNRKELAYGTYVNLAGTAQCCSLSL